MKASEEAIEYYQLGENASFREMVAHIRADEACHRDLNHHFADIKFYEDVDMHTVTIVEKEDKPGAEDDHLPKQKLQFGEEQPAIGDGNKN